MTYKYKQMCEIYRIFADPWKDACDFSNTSMKEMFDYESSGIGTIEINGFNVTGKKANGYAVGKKWLNVTVAMWFEEADNYGLIQLLERLYNDKNFPHWWLDKVFNRIA